MEIPKIKLNQNAITYIEGGVVLGLAVGLAAAFFSQGRKVAWVIASTVIGAGLGFGQYHLNKKSGKIPS